ncbi:MULTISPECIES: PaaI family thioesterase [unclassified Pseudomonas]|uniref:PaaI family thioesterase n=1 Tax=unclassified Pseudomonas TaxID=196821 RepID=UPI00119C7FB7|nr:MULTISPECIES: PaaI family thioesterase [unclassified Pseudomonas]TWC11661.1 acyl-coenzyme A thioesterase PaaI-like protein [Pseudomonas sp. SJZ074]TWC13596.1 acyl-coenzyme A thioesterase PaaI-like protein [Pseudomonas sp. SJZ075]TWC29853.1 acyl-coenzyme A thioesterase PaaI-like protein [Pseudomonas sp. SJZ078]TWC30312.1 acyl-coenzyme A thioesterase PaaI-like protein [Pseudomonas sp. SJZ085]TWC50834.1 acyl-coenzyme A thioesterase PaaI-like protein [Pseudomonas sp. SJZ124]
MTDITREYLRQACEQGDPARLLAAIPYAQLIGAECTRQGDDLIFRLPANKDNIGNPLLPAIHGGVIAGFMELAAAVHLLIATRTPGVPKIIDFSLDYLRAGQFRDTYARCQVWRQGRRVANVAITAWQGVEAEPIATARAHFKIQEPAKPDHS